MDLSGMRILAEVRPKHGENPCHRKGKGSLTMKLSQGLVDPNSIHNLEYEERETR